MREVSKRFGATRALDGVSLDLRPGEVHALVGENGAGKSTLIKIMTGIHPADDGEVVLNGEPVSLSSAADAQRHGIAAIYQEPLIFPDLSVAENVFIGHRDQGRVVRWRRMCAEAGEILARLDVHLDPRMPAGGLPVAAQQAIEIAKAISLDVRVLIMDEPTAALSAHEVERLFRQVRQLRDAGVAVLFISHRLDEVFAIADRITVFRDGRRISTSERGQVTQGQLISAMVGRDVSDFFARTEHHAGDVVLRVRELGRTGTFSGVSFDVRRGEVLGLAGLVGAGRTDVALALFGIAPAETGTIELDGEPAPGPAGRGHDRHVHHAARRPPAAAAGVVADGVHPYRRPRRRARCGPRRRPGRVALHAVDAWHAVDRGGGGRQ
jgi:rhamnose transport system ATP-binding protein